MGITNMLLADVQILTELKEKHLKKIALLERKGRIADELAGKIEWHAENISSTRLTNLDTLAARLELDEINKKLKELE
jgi:hypothetical protein